MGIGERGADPPLDVGQRSDRRRARAAVLAEDQRQSEIDFGARAALDVKAAGDDDLAVVQEALSELDRLEGEIAPDPERVIS